jgi:hypothetical protein
MQQPETHVSSKQRIDEIDRARAQEYALIATLLSRSPDIEMIGRVALLRGDASPLGAAHAGLGEAARGANKDDLAQEYFDLFAGLGGGSLLPYSSHYLTGALYGRPPARKPFGILASKKRQGIRNRRIMPRSIAKSWQGLSVAASQLLPVPIVISLKDASWIGRFFADLEQARIS